MKTEQLLRAWLGVATLAAAACVSLDRLPVQGKDGETPSVEDSDAEADVAPPDEGPVVPAAGADAEVAWPDAVVVIADAGVAAATCACTRRPEGVPDRRCPWGTGATTAAKVGERGATVQVAGSPSTVGVEAEVKIPAGALQQATALTFTELKSPPPTGYVDYSPVYRLEPIDLTLQSPGEILLPFSNLHTLIPRALSIYRAESPEGPFTRMADSYINAGFSQATLIHGGYYFVGYVTPEEEMHCP